jgi:hypothetical protein
VDVFNPDYTSLAHNATRRSAPRRGGLARVTERASCERSQFREPPQAARATYERTVLDAERAIDAGQFAEAEKTLQAVVGTLAGDDRAGKLVSRVRELSAAALARETAAVPPGGTTPDVRQSTQGTTVTIAEPGPTVPDTDLYKAPPERNVETRPAAPIAKAPDPPRNARVDPRPTPAAPIDEARAELEGTTAYLAGDYDAAIRLLRPVFDIDPPSSRVAFYLACSYVARAALGGVVAEPTLDEARRMFTYAGGDSDVRRRPRVHLAGRAAPARLDRHGHRGEGGHGVMTTRRVRALTLALVMTAGLPPAAFAQTSLQIPLQFDFLNPGAKSLAMGGAFSGVADDATATLANPAGLIQIGQREVSLEGRVTSNNARFLQGGRLSGTVLNEGLDTVSGPQFGDSRGTHAGPTFLSVVLPFARTDPADPLVGQTRWVLAAQRHELVRVDQQFQSTGVFQQAPGDLTSVRERPQQSDRQLSITSYGLSMAYAVRPGIAIGGGLSLYRFSIDSIFRRFDTFGFLGAPNTGTELGRSTQVGDDTGVAPSLGLLIGTAGRTRAGVLYRHGPSFTFQTVEALGGPERDVTFRVPHTLAVGLSHRPQPSILLRSRGDTRQLRAARAGVRDRPGRHRPRAERRASASTTAPRCTSARSI